MNSMLARLGLTALLLPGSSLFAQQPPTEAPVKPASLVEAKKEQLKREMAEKAQAVEQGQQAAGGGQVQSSGGNAWFEATNMDLGTFFGQGEAVGVFKFKNPNDQPFEWTLLTPSCQCAQAIIRVGDRTYKLAPKGSPNRLLRVTSAAGQPEATEPVPSIPIAAGAAGEVEVHLNMSNITGPKHATLDIHGTDPQLPQAKLSFHAAGAKLFSVSPEEVNLNKMTWNDTREFTVTVVSPMYEDFNIVGMDDAGETFDVNYEKSTSGGRATWTIHGKYGPVSGEVAGGGVLKFRTDLNNGASFMVRVLAFVEGPLEVKPGGFLTLGLIRKGKSLTREIVFEPNDGVDLQAQSLTFEKLTLPSEFVTATPRKDGNKLIVDLSVSDKAPAGLLKGDLVVQLNHPLVKEKRILFNGFVR